MPNKITPANAGIALSFHVGHTWPGVAEFYRSAASAHRARINNERNETMKTLRAVASGFSILLMVLCVIGILRPFFVIQWYDPFWIVGTLLTTFIYAVVFWTGWNNRRALRQVDSTEQFDTVFFLANALVCLLPLAFLSLRIIDEIAMAHEGLEARGFAGVGALAYVAMVSIFAAAGILSITVAMKAKKKARLASVENQVLG